MRVLLPLVLVASTFGFAGLAASGSACSSHACIVSISAGGTCIRAADGSEYGFVHPTGGAHVQGDLPIFTYDYGLYDSIGLGWRATNWPGPINHQLTAMDTQQGWLLPTVNHVYRYTWTAYITTNWPLANMWSDAQVAYADIPCI